MTPQSVRDALADAETLKLFVGQHPEFGDARLAVYAARHHGRYIERARYPMAAADAGVLAARAAFRAVPALREVSR